VTYSFIGYFNCFLLTRAVTWFVVKGDYFLMTFATLIFLRYG